MLPPSDSMQAKMFLQHVPTEMTRWWKVSWVDQASHLESTWTLALALENTWDQPGEHLDLDQPGEHLENTREHLDTGSGSTGQKVSTNQPGEKCGPNLAGENFAPNLPGRKSTWSNTWFSLKHGLVNMLCTPGREPGWKSVWESGNLFGNLARNLVEHQGNCRPPALTLAPTHKCCCCSRGPFSELQKMAESGLYKGCKKVCKRDNI